MADILLDTQIHYVGVNPPSGDYNDMDNKPAIDGVTLTSSTTKADLGLDKIYNYKGQKENYSDLPTSGNKIGDVWNIKNADEEQHIKAGDNVAWNEENAWDILSGQFVQKNADWNATEGVQQVLNKPKINGITLEGNIDIKTYSPFPDDFVKDETFEAFVSSVINSPSATEGSAYLGGISGNWMPWGDGNAECKVEFMGDGLALLTVSSSDIAPYHWEYNTYSDDYKWKSNIIQITNLNDAYGYEGLIVHYVGETTVDYINGYFYKCVDDAWTQVDIQPTQSGLPDQTGHAGHFLTTDGTDASWVEVNTSITGVGVPSTSTVGQLGQIYVDTTNKDGYICVNVDDTTPEYTWKKITYTPTSTTIQVLSANWNPTTKEYTIPVVGLTANTVIWVAPTVSSDNTNEEMFATYGVRAKVQSANTLTLGCTVVPPSNLNIDIIM